MSDDLTLKESFWKLAGRENMVNICISSPYLQFGNPSLRALAPLTAAACRASAAYRSTTAGFSAVVLMTACFSAVFITAVWLSAVFSSDFIVVTFKVV